MDYKKTSCTIGGLFAWKKRQTKATSWGVHPAALRCFEGLLLRGKDHSGRMRMVNSGGKFWLSFLDVKNILFLVLKGKRLAPSTANTDGQLDQQQDPTGVESNVALGGTFIV